MNADEQEEQIDQLLKELASERVKKIDTGQISPSERQELLREVERVLSPSGKCPGSFENWWKGRWIQIGFAVLVVLVLVVYLPHSFHPINDLLIKGVKGDRLVWNETVIPPDDNWCRWILAELEIGKNDMATGNTFLQRLTIPSANEVTLGEGDTAQKRITLESPVNTAVRRTPITFRWRALNAAQEYEILVKVVSKGLTSQVTTKDVVFRWLDQIEPGIVYEWQVVSMVLGKPAKSQTAQFRVLPSADLAELESLEARYAQSSLVLAAVYRHFGLVEEFRTARARFFSANPDFRPLKRAKSNQPQ